jgi:hypothetical protein
MRVFHFVPAKHGLSDIRHRRLKIATLRELNDPFEFLGVDLRDQRSARISRVRHALYTDLFGVSAAAAIPRYSGSDTRGPTILMR